MSLYRVIVLRGLSGSGKSTVALQHAANVPGAIIVSSDAYFMVGGEYKFDFDKLNEAHGSCFRAFMAAIENEAPLIIVDNTNARAVEIAPYMLAGGAYGYDCSVLTVACDPEVAAARNVHNTPRDIVMEMAERLKAEPLPPWWKNGEILSVPEEVVRHQVDTSE